MLFGLNENTTVATVEEMVVPAHLAESFEGIVALGNMKAEKLYEEVLNIQGEFTAKLQRGVSTGKLDEACAEILQEGALGSFFGKVKEMFKKLWEAIKALFTKFMAWLDSKIKSDKDFIAKYKKTLIAKAGEVSDMEYKGHNWSFGPAPGTKVTVEIEKTIDKVDEKSKNILKDGIVTNDGYAGRPKHAEAGKSTDNDAMRIAFGEAKADGSDREQLIEEGIKVIAAALGVGQLTDPAEVVSEFREKIHGGSIEAETMTGPKVGELIKIVEDYEKDKKDSEKSMKEYEKTFRETIKTLEKLEKSAANAKSATVDLSTSTLIAVAKAQASLANQIAGVFLAALKERRDEARSILAKVVTYKKK